MNGSRFFSHKKRMMLIFFISNYDILYTLNLGDYDYIYEGKF